MTASKRVLGMLNRRCHRCIRRWSRTIILTSTRGCIRMSWMKIRGLSMAALTRTHETTLSTLKIKVYRLATGFKLLISNLATLQQVSPKCQVNRLPGDYRISTRTALLAFTSSNFNRKIWRIRNNSILWFKMLKSVTCCKRERFLMWVRVWLSSLTPVLVAKMT